MRWLWLALCVALLIVPAVASAQSNDGGWNNSGGGNLTVSDYCATCTDHGVLNMVLTSITNAAQGLLGPFTAYSRRLFYALILLSTLWWAFTLLMKKNSIEDLVVSLGFRMFSLVFFNWLFLEAVNGQLFQSIINSISGLSGINGTSTTAINGLNPSDIITLYTGLTNNVNDPATSLAQTVTSDGGNPLQVTKDYVMNTMLGSMTTSVFDLVMWVSGAIIACEVLIFRAEQQIALPLLYLIVAFIGSGWTLQLGERGLAYALSIGIRLATAGIVVSVTLSVYSSAVNDMQTNGLFTNVSPETLGVLIMVSLISVGLSIFIPVIAGSALSGSPQMTFTGLATVSTAITAGIMRGASSGVLNAIGGSAKHGQNALHNASDSLGRGAMALQNAGSPQASMTLRGAQHVTSGLASASQGMTRHLREAVHGVNPKTGEPNDTTQHGLKSSVDRLRGVAFPGGNQPVSAPAIRLSHHEN